MRSLKAKCAGALAAVIVLGVGVAGTKQCEADSAFSLIDTAAVYLSDASTLIPAGNLVQLVWTADMAYHPATPGGLDSAGYAGSGDFILFSGLTTIAFGSGGGWVGDLDGSATYDSGDVGGAPLPSGFVYARIFEAGSAAAVTGNTWFLQTGFVTVNNEQTNVPPDTADTVDVAPGGGAGPMGGSVLDMQVNAVPEPVTLAGMGLGLLAILAWRRRIRA